VRQHTQSFDSPEDLAKHAMGREGVPAWAMLLVFVLLGVCAFFAAAASNRSDKAIADGIETEKKVEVLKAQKEESDRRFNEIHDWMKEIRDELRAEGKH
jgi:hypothetical protein